MGMTTTRWAGTHRKIIAKLSVVEIKHKCDLANIKDNESNEREGNEVLQTKWSDIIGDTKEDSILSSVYKLIGW